MPHEHSPSLRKPGRENPHYSPRRAGSRGSGGPRQGHSTEEAEGDGLRRHSRSRNQGNARESAAARRDPGDKFWQPGHGHNRPLASCRHFCERHGLKGASITAAEMQDSRLAVGPPSQPFPPTAEAEIWVPSLWSGLSVYFERLGRRFSVKATSNQITGKS
jgi:hypothetical protein